MRKKCCDPNRFADSHQGVVCKKFYHKNTLNGNRNQENDFRNTPKAICKVK